MNCQEVENFIEINLSDVEETFRFPSEVNGHLQECPACQSYYRNQLKFLELVQSSFDRLNPSAEFEERLSSFAKATEDRSVTSDPLSLKLRRTGQLPACRKLAASGEPRLWRGAGRSVKLPMTDNRLLITKKCLVPLSLAAGVLIVIVFGFFIFNEMEKPFEPDSPVSEITGTGTPTVSEEPISGIAVFPQLLASELIVFNFNSGIQSEFIIIEDGGFRSEEIIIE